MMDDPTVLSMVIGVAVIVLIGGLGLVMSKSSGSTGRGPARRAHGRTPGRQGQESKTSASGILARPAAIDLGRPSFWTRIGPQRREPQPALRTGRRQLFVQTVHGGRRRAGASPERSSASFFDCRSSSCPLAALVWVRSAVPLADAPPAASGSGSSSKPCPRPSS